MKTHIDSRGADRRAPTAFGTETGYDIPATVPVKRKHWEFAPRPVIIPDCGCHAYEARGVMYTRCETHRPRDSRDLGPVVGACVCCAVGV